MQSSVTLWNLGDAVMDNLLRVCLQAAS